MPFIESSQLLNLRQVAPVQGKEMGPDGENGDEYDETVLSDAESSYQTIEQLSVIWEETTADLKSVASFDSIPSWDSTTHHNSTNSPSSSTPRLSLAHSPSPLVASDRAKRFSFGGRERFLIDTSMVLDSGSDSDFELDSDTDDSQVELDSGSDDEKPKQQQQQQQQLTAADDGDRIMKLAPPATSSTDQTAGRPQQNERLDLDMTSHAMMLTSLHTGEEVTFPLSDDEYTLISCTTGDESIQESFRSDFEGSFRSFADDDDTPADTPGNFLATFPQNFTLDEDELPIISLNMPEMSNSLQTIPEVDESFIMEDKYEISRQNINYEQSRVSLSTKLLKRRRSPPVKKWVVAALQRKLNFEKSRDVLENNLARRESADLISQRLDPRRRKSHFDLMRQSVQDLFRRSKYKMPRPEGSILSKLTRSVGSKNLVPKSTPTDVPTGTTTSTSTSFSSPTSESDPSTDTIDSVNAVKMRLKLERFGGQRRRISFQRSRSLLQKSMGRLEKQKFRGDTDAGTTCSDEATIRTTKTTQRRHQPQAPTREWLERFGGLHRLDSYRKSRQLFAGTSNDNEIPPITTSAKVAASCPSPSSSSTPSTTTTSSSADVALRATGKIESAGKDSNVNRSTSTTKALPPAPTKNSMKGTILDTQECRSRGDDYKDYQETMNQNGDNDENSPNPHINSAMNEFDATNTNTTTTTTTATTTRNDGSNTSKQQRRMVSGGYRSGIPTTTATGGRRHVRRSYSDSNALPRSRTKNSSSSGTIPLSKRKSKSLTSAEGSPILNDDGHTEATTATTTTTPSTIVPQDDQTVELTSLSSNSSSGSTNSITSITSTTSTSSDTSNIINSDPPPRRVEAPEVPSRPSTGPRPAPASRSVRRSHSYDSSVLLKKQNRKKKGTKTDADGYWSYNLNRKRLKGEMARQRLRQAFDSCSVRQANHNISATTTSTTTPTTTGSGDGIDDIEAILPNDDDWLDQSERSFNGTIERILQTLEKDPMSETKSPVIVKARKKLQDAFRSGFNISLPSVDSSSATTTATTTTTTTTTSGSGKNGTSATASSTTNPTATATTPRDHAKTAPATSSLQ